MGDLNTRLDAERTSDVVVSTRLSSWGLQVSLVDHFLLKRKHHTHSTWMHPERRYWDQCDYILAEDRNKWTGVRYIQPRKLCTDHIMILGNLKLENIRENK